MFPFSIQLAWQVAQAVIACSLLLPVVLHFILYLQKMRQKQTSVSEELFEEKDFAIIVSVSHWGENTSRIIRSLLQLQYSNYLVYVVTSKNINPRFYTENERVVWLPFSDENIHPSGLHRFAFYNFKRPHTHAVLLNANCIADANFLNGLNVCFHQGFQMVQTRIIPKTERSFANRLYALRNVYQQFFQRHVLFSLGSSATVADNGVACNVSFYKTYILSANVAAAGLTSSLIVKLIQQGYQVAFAETALLFEENEKNFQQSQMRALQNRNTFSKQVSTKVQLLSKGIVCLNKNLFLSGLTLLQLPLFTTLFLAIFCLFINICTNSLLALFWIMGLLVFSSSLLSINYWQESKRKPSSAGSSVLTQIQNSYGKSEVEMYSAV